MEPHHISLLRGFELYLEEKMWHKTRSLDQSLWNTWATVELHPRRNVILPFYWQKPNVACCDWWNQFVVHHSVTVLISIKHLKMQIPNSN